MSLEWFPAEHRSRSTLIGSTMWACAASSMALVAFLLRGYTWRHLQFALSGVSVLAFLQWWSAHLHFSHRPQDQTYTASPSTLCNVLVCKVCKDHTRTVAKIHSFRQGTRWKFLHSSFSSSFLGIFYKHKQKRGPRYSLAQYLFSSPDYIYRHSAERGSCR